MAGKENRSSRKLGNSTIAIACVVFVASMVGAAYASVPLYRLFCQVTGFGGTTQTAEEAGGEILERTIKIQFDANISEELDWIFVPVQREIELRIGETALAFYRARNRGAATAAGSAIFNVTPVSAGQYFNKIDCFCFSEQVLQAGQTVDMPVSFFVDPAIADDRDLDNVTTITLSYTFYEDEIDGDDTASMATDARTNVN